MKQSLQLKLGQQLTMTPQLQQAIRLLQLSSMELELEVQQVLDSNMMLELDDEDEREVIDFNAEGALELLERPDLVLRVGERSAAGRRHRHVAERSELLRLLLVHRRGPRRQRLRGQRRRRR